MKQDPDTNWRRPFMHTNYLAVKINRIKFSTHHSKLDALGFFNQIRLNQLFERVESILPDHRERTFYPMHMF